MLKKIKVVPLAEESLGVRSMCTYIQSPDVNFLLDPGVSLAPKRMGYAPHPQEYKVLSQCREEISKFVEKTHVISVSHYHFDHHTPSYTDWFTNWSSPEIAENIYKGKIVLAKSYRSKVNSSQRRRGWIFKKTGGNYAKKFEIADGKSFDFGETILKFSEPVFHGSENSELGWLVMATIEFAEEKVVFASDIQGPMFTPTLNKILAENPQLVIVGGPPTYLVGIRVKNEDITKGMQNLKSLVSNVPTTVLGHHLFRDANWSNFFQPIFDVATDIGNKVLTPAEYLGKKNNFLENRRKQLFETEPLDPDFKIWMKLLAKKRKLTKPPI